MSSIPNSSAPTPAPAPEPGAPKPSVVPSPEPGRRRLKWPVAIALLLVAGGVAYYLATRSAIKTAGGGPPVISIPTVTVTEGNLNRTIRITGTIEARNYASLTAPRILGSRNNTNRGGMGGYGLAGPPPIGAAMGPDFTLILLHLVKGGAHVTKGDVVAQFDPTNQLLRLDDYKDAVIQTDNSIKKMIASLAATKEAHDQTVRAARAAFDQAKLDLKKAPVQSAIDAENAKITAEANEAAYKELVSEDPLVVEQQAAIIRVSELSKAQTAIEEQRAEGNVKRMEIHAPMDGIAVMGSIVRNGEYGQVREGDQINAGQPFLTIVDPSSMILNATVNQVDAESLRIGMKAIVHLDAYPDIALAGVVEGIGAMAKTSTFRASYVSTIPMRIRIDQSDSRVLPDLTGSADVVLSSENNVLLLPRPAVFEENGGAFVFVRGAEGWVKKQVELGQKGFMQVAIHSGLQKGDVVALTRPL